MNPAVRERLQRFERLPHRQVHDHQGIVEDPDVGGVTAVGLQTPHIPRRLLAYFVHARQRVDEIGNARVVEWMLQCGDVQLDEVSIHRAQPVAAVAAASRRFLRKCRATSMSTFVPIARLKAVTNALV